MNEIAIFHPEFVVAGVYSVVMGIGEIVKASKGIQSDRSVGAGAIGIILVGGLMKSAIRVIQTKEQERKK